jgi:hypothetical protein
VLFLESKSKQSTVRRKNTKINYYGLKRIIRQYLNQHLPENIMPAQKLDRKAKK